jgi:para-aminobenzoate synthetase component 2
MFLMIDNYDSFVYNLVRYFEELDENVVVYRNDKITIRDIEKMNLQGIIISPGPKHPRDSGICLEVIEKFKETIPILGICLGHQAIGFAFGAKIVKGKEPVHGIVSKVYHESHGIFKGIKSPINATRYHSLIIEKETLPDCFSITAKSSDGVIMGISHKKYLIEGVQFHPEAELTECGHDLLKNFIDQAKAFQRRQI